MYFQIYNFLCPLKLFVQFRWKVKKLVQSVLTTTTYLVKNCGRTAQSQIPAIDTSASLLTELADKKIPRQALCDVT